MSLDQVIKDMVNNHIVGKKILRVDLLGGTAVNLYIEDLDKPIRITLGDGYHGPG